MPSLDRGCRNRAAAPPRTALPGIPPRIAPAIVAFMFGALAREPLRVGKPLKRALAGLFGTRRGPYRVPCRIDEENQNVYVVHIDHRGDVYRPR